MSSGPRMVVVARVSSLLACTDPGAEKRVRLAEEHCDGLGRARDESLAYFTRARELTQPGDAASATDDATFPRHCHALRESLAAGNGFIDGLNSLASVVAGPLDKPVAFVDGYRKRITEAEELCRRAQTPALLELLAELERTVGASFDPHLATCRERGWRPAEQRLAGPAATR